MSCAPPTWKPDGSVTDPKDWKILVLEWNEVLYRHVKTQETRFSLIESNETFKRPRLYWKNWVAIVDPSTTKRYFYNRDTKETTWTMPVKFRGEMSAESAAALEAKAAAFAAAQENSQKQLTQEQEMEMQKSDEPFFDLDD